MKTFNKFLISFLGVNPAHVARHATENGSNQLALYGWLVLLASASIAFSLGILGYELLAGSIAAGIGFGIFGVAFGRALELGVLHSNDKRAVAVRAVALVLMALLLSTSVSLLTMQDEIQAQHEQHASIANAELRRPVDVLEQQKKELTAQLAFRQQTLEQEAQRFEQLAEAEAAGVQGQVYAGRMSSPHAGCGPKCDYFLTQAAKKRQEAKQLAYSQNDSVAALERQISLKSSEVTPRFVSTEGRLSLGAKLTSLIELISSDPGQLLAFALKFLASILIEGLVLITRALSPKNSYLRLLEEDEQVNATYNEALAALLNEHCKAATQGNQPAADEYQRRAKTIQTAAKDHLKESKSIAEDEASPAADEPAAQQPQPDFATTQPPF